MIHSTRLPDKNLIKIAWNISKRVLNSYKLAPCATVFYQQDPLPRLSPKKKQLTLPCKAAAGAYWKVGELIWRMTSSLKAFRIGEAMISYMSFETLNMRIQKYSKILFENWTLLSESTSFVNFINATGSFPPRGLKISIRKAPVFQGQICQLTHGAGGFRVNINTT